MTIEIDRDSIPRSYPTWKYFHSTGAGETGRRGC